MKAIRPDKTGNVVDRDELGVCIRWPYQWSSGPGQHTAWYTWEELERFNIKIEGGQGV